MDHVNAQIVTVILAIVVNAVVQIITIQVFRKLGLLRTILLGFAAGFVTLILRLDSFSLTNPYLWINLISFVCLSYIYFQFLNIGEASLRIRVLKELEKAGGGLPKSDVMAVYSATTILDYRLQRLTESAEVVFIDGRYVHSQAKMLWIARIFVVLKKFVLGRHWKDPIAEFKPH